LVTIRRLGEDDVAVFRQIRLEALRKEPGAFASTAADWEALPEEEWRRRLQAPVFVAFSDGEPVGIMGLLRQGSSKMAHRATIVMVYVRRDLRGAGVAPRLLGALVDYASEHGIRQLELAVSMEEPAARRFYRKHGFAELCTIPGGFLHEGREIDEVLMARRVPVTG
jgi:GNAT superfamily N-acetyltransferase